MAHALNEFYLAAEEPLVLWKGEFDLNTLRVDGEIFESGIKKLWIQKYPDTRGRGLKIDRSVKTL